MNEYGEKLNKLIEVLKGYNDEMKN